jgi:hypothetical protein
MSDAPFDREARVVVRALVGFWSDDATARVALSLRRAERAGRVQGMRDAALIAGRSHEFGFVETRASAQVAQNEIERLADAIEKQDMK